MGLPPCPCPPSPLPACWGLAGFTGNLLLPGCLPFPRPLPLGRFGGVPGLPPTAPPTAPVHTPHRQTPSRWASRLRRPLHRTFLWVCLPQLSAQERGLDHRVKLPPHSEQDPLKGPGLDSMSPDLSKSRFPWSGSQKSGWRNPTRGIPRRGPPPPTAASATVGRVLPVR